MTAARPMRLRGVSALPIGGIGGGMAVLASPRVRTLAETWVGSSQRYFEAMRRWGEAHPDRPTRKQVENECDIAILEDEAVRLQIIDLPASEPGAVALKAAAYLVHRPSFETIDQAIGDAVLDEGPCSDALALVIARDMAAIFGPPIEALAAAARRGRSI